MQSYKEYQQVRQVLRSLVRAREDFQAMRIRMDNRCGLTAKRKKQENLTERAFEGSDFDMIYELSIEARKNERDCEKKLIKTLKRMPIWNEWLGDIKGIGKTMGGWILGEFDVFKMDTVSKAWQYAGLNPSQVRGVKRIKKGKTFEFITTDTLVRGDKLTPGFVSPFNKSLRSALQGILADLFVRKQNEYALEFYYPYKNRLEQSTNQVMHADKGKKAELTAWKDVSAGHRDSAAKRYMIKMFLQDLYNQWRPLYNLPVREPYMEEFLGKKHQVA